MDPIDALLPWATARGVQLNGIAPSRLPGRGVGIIATRAIEPGEVLLEIPTACLRTTDTVSAELERQLPGNISVHGLLAADLARDLVSDATDQAPWDAVCPTPEDFVTLPLLWPAELQKLLPSGARELLEKQQAKLARDWADVKVAFPEPEAGDEAGGGDSSSRSKGGLASLSPEELYRYAWILVNTRTFYWHSSGSSNSKSKSSSKRGDDKEQRAKRRKVRPTDADSCMCLQPVADLFNHDDREGCNVAFDDEGYTVRATRAFTAGAEVRISYGRHAGDFLLVEYGFVVDDALDGGNRWDEVALDDVLLPHFSSRQKALLDEVGFLGKYVLDGNQESEDVACHRTQVAVRLLCCGVSEWRMFVDGVEDGEASQGAVNALLEEVLEEYKRKAEKRIREVERLKKVGEPAQRAVLAKRWGQIRDLLDVNIARLQESDGDSD